MSKHPVSNDLCQACCRSSDELVPLARRDAPTSYLVRSASERQADVRERSYALTFASIYYYTFSLQMEEDEDDDIYAPSDAIEIPAQRALPTVETDKRGNDPDDGEEEGEEIEEDTSDSVYQVTYLFPFLNTDINF